MLAETEDSGLVVGCWSRDRQVPRFDNDEKRSNSARTDAVKSTIIEIRDRFMLEYYYPVMQKRVRTLVCKVYGDVDTIVEKTYSYTEDPRWPKWYAISYTGFIIKISSSPRRPGFNVLPRQQTKHEEEFRNAISTQLKDMKAEIMESKSKQDEVFQTTMLSKIKQAAEREDEFRRLVYV
ncbi:hypothetical protein DPMN_155249 [Dreissena polymorpha]|uniref:Uncharacterized protein n=1 Tax=Dreissena polymorpha TaxID=45954 RepID=A0A9D4FLX6_DREPO|nr:hypothetical protein DPMN_155249 [Dreissena polymorpha]